MIYLILLPLIACMFTHFCIDRAAGFNMRQGSHVWEALGDTLKEQPEPVNLLRWLRKTNQKLQEKEYEIENARYMPLLSICHTLTKHVQFKKAN